MIRLAVHGAKGRMGSRILELARAGGAFEIAGEFDQELDSRICTEAIRNKGNGVLIDFSSPAGTMEALVCAAEAGWGIVIGTTGLGDEVRRVAQSAAKKIPVVVSSNMSIGVNVMLALLELASKKLPKPFKVEMSEAHHVHKKDAPSGTALMLAKRIAEARPLDFDALSKRIQVTREGEIVGDHAVVFEGPEETLEIRHHAKSRDIFAQGALLAAQFAATAKPGLYSMTDVLK